MTKPLPEDDKKKIVNLHVCDLLTIREISSETGYSTGAISGVLKEALKKWIPDLDELRRLSQAIKGSNLSWLQLMRWANMSKRLDVLEISFDDIPRCVRFLEKQGKNADLRMEAALRLQELESKSGKSYEELLIEYRRTENSLSEAKASLEEVHLQLEELKNAVRSLRILKKIQDIMDENEITLSNLSSYIQTHKKLKAKGFTSDVATTLEGALSRFRLSPKEAASVAAEILAKYPDLNKVVKDLEKRKAILETEVSNLASLVEGLKEKKAFLEDTISDQIETERRLDKKIDAVRQEHMQQKERLTSEYDQLLQKLEKESADKERELDIKFERKKQEFDAEISARETKKDQLENDIAQIEGGITGLQRRLETVESIIKEKAVVASIVSLMNKPEDAGEPQIVVKTLLALLIGFDKYVKLKSASLKNSIAIGQFVKQGREALSDEISDASR